jgi:hypothetical protein
MKPKNCPFCGSDDVGLYQLPDEHDAGSPSHEWVIKCDECDSHGPIILGLHGISLTRFVKVMPRDEIEKKATKYWNMRTPENER